MVTALLWPIGFEADEASINRYQSDSEEPGFYIVLYLQPELNPKSYDGVRVLEASGRPMLVIGRSYWVGPIQEEDEETGMVTCGTTKLTEEIME